MRGLDGRVGIVICAATCFMKCGGREVGPFNVTANSIARRHVDTKNTNVVRLRVLVEVIESRTPLARLVDSDDIARWSRLPSLRRRSFIAGSSSVLMAVN